MTEKDRNTLGPQTARRGRELAPRVFLSFSIILSGVKDLLK